MCSSSTGKPLRSRSRRQVRDPAEIRLVARREHDPVGASCAVAEVEPAAARVDDLGARRGRGRGSIRGSSQCSSVSRPTSQKRRAIASRSACGSVRHQPGWSSVCSISGSTKRQLDALEARLRRGGGRRRRAPRRARRSAPPTRTRSGGRRRSARARRRARRSRRGRRCARPRPPSRAGGRSGRRRARRRPRAPDRAAVASVAAKSAARASTTCSSRPRCRPRLEPRRRSRGTARAGAGRASSSRQEASKRQLVGRVQVPVRAGAQEHARGHVLAPEAHRAAEDGDARPLSRAALAAAQAVRPGADDERRQPTRSRTASPCPPPPHSVATPSPPPRRRSS